MTSQACSYAITALHRCLSFGNAASARKWDLSASNEALFWFQLALSIDHRNVAALIGSATIYQYILSQPWWHNNLRIINGAFSRGSQLLRTANEFKPNDAAIYTTQGAIYSAIGKAEIADEYLQQAISLNSEFAPSTHSLSIRKVIFDLAYAKGSSLQNNKRTRDKWRLHIISTASLIPSMANMTLEYAT